MSWWQCVLDSSQFVPLPKAELYKQQFSWCLNALLLFPRYCFHKGENPISPWTYLICYHKPPHPLYSRSWYLRHFGCYRSHLWGHCTSGCHCWPPSVGCFAACFEHRPHWRWTINTRSLRSPLAEFSFQREATIPPQPPLANCSSVVDPSQDQQPILWPELSLSLIYLQPILWEMSRFPSRLELGLPNTNRWWKSDFSYHHTRHGMKLIS